MAADNISKHFKELRVDTGRRRRRDPFADSFDDERDDDKERSSRPRTKQHLPAATQKEKAVAAAPAKNNNNNNSSNIASPFTALDGLRDSDDDEQLLGSQKRVDRRPSPSPAPAQLALSRVTSGAGRRGSLDAGLQSKGLLGRGVQAGRAPRSAIAQAAGSLAYLDDSETDEEEVLPRKSAADRFPSPAPPRKQSDPVDPLARSSTPKGTRDLVREPEPLPRHTVASPFAGTKYLEDSESDSDEEAVTSRSGSLESATEIPVAASPEKEKHRLDVTRVDKPKQNGGGVSWRAFSAGRAEQRSAEIEALQASLRQRGKSIAFGTHAVTDDGNRVPVAPTPEQIFAGARGRRKGRGKSPPRRAADASPGDVEVGDGGPGGLGVHDPAQFKTNPFSGGLSASQIETPPLSDLEIPNEQAQVPARLSLLSGSTTSPTSDLPSSPTDGGATLESSTGSLTSKMTISPPQTIPEGKTIDMLMSPVMSPTEEVRNPLSRNSSARDIRMVGSRPARIPSSGSRRRESRRSSANPSPSPAHAYLSSWSREGAAAEPAPEPKPDDEGQAIGLNNEYIIGRLINQGGFGVVKEVHTIAASGEPIVRAVKIVRKAIPGKEESENDKVQQELDHEVSVWRHLKHRNILELHAVYDTDFATFCVMDLNVGGTLFDVVKRYRACAADNDGRKGLPPKLAKNYAFQLACALRYLHEDIRVCHRDVKLENCLIDMSVPNAETEGGVLRLCDYGLADFLHSEMSIDDPDPVEQLGSPLMAAPAVQAHSRHPSSVIGTLEYASPKGLSADRKLFETAGDVWAFGVVVYALVTGDLPFRHSLPYKTVEKILQAEWDDKALEYAAAGGSEVKELVAGCLERDIDIRLTMGDVVRNEWFAGMEEQIGGNQEERWD